MISLKLVCNYEVDLHVHTTSSAKVVPVWESIASLRNEHLSLDIIDLSYMLSIRKRKAIVKA